MCSAWRGQDPRPSGRRVGIDKLKTVKDQSPSSNGRGIEDVEQSALDKLLGGDRIYAYSQTGSQGHSLFGWGWTSTSENIFTEQNSNPSSASTSEGTTNLPIRKRFDTYNQPDLKYDADYEIDPITNRKVPKKTSNKTAENSRKAIEVPVKLFKGYRSQFRVFAQPDPSNNNGTIHLDGKPSQAELKSYMPFDFNKLHEQLHDKPDPVNETLKDYDNRQASASALPSERHEPFRFNEPDRQLPRERDIVADGLRDFDEASSKLTSTNHRENNINQNMLDQYRPFKFNEPNGQMPREVDHPRNGLEEYDSRSQGRSSPGLDSGIIAPSLPPRRRGAVESSLNQPNKFSSSRFRIPDSDKAEDLDLLRASDVRAASGIIRGPRKETEEEKLAKRRVLEEEFHKPQGLETSYAEELAAAEKVKESRKRAQDLKIECSELLNHNAHARGRVNAKIAEVEESWPKTSPERKMTGNFVRDFPEEFQASWTTGLDASNEILTPKTSHTDGWGYDKSPKGLELSYQQEVENDVQKVENEYTDGLASQEAFTRNSNTPRIQTSLDRSQAGAAEKEGIDSADRLQAEVDPYSKEPQGLETCYSNEISQQSEEDLSTLFSHYSTSKPEEAHIVTSEDSAPDPSKRSLKKLKEKDEELVREARSIYEETYGTINYKHRQGGTTQPTNALKSTQNLNEAHGAERVPDPTLYKILAYDPTMQAIKTAEATSTVADTSSALTPAEVLLRLSNPAKFFPHFEPLQAQGYEIVSGSGDILIFRMVQPAGSPVISGQSKSSQVAQAIKKTSRNPIDGMQGGPIAATGNFASPTGFVNHDLPVSSEPPFKSNIDVRREEPVFSGQKSSWQEGSEAPPRKNQKKGRKLMVGAAWVAACSYAVGAVVEFFRTGGMDGKGPVGF